MNAGHHVLVDASIAEVDRLLAFLKKGKTVQVWSTDEKGIAKATALSWFNAHHAELTKAFETNPLITRASSLFQELISFTDRATSRPRYIKHLKELRGVLAELRTSIVAGKLAPARVGVISESPPSFAKLVKDSGMQVILAKRWEECTRCIEADAPLAATVMMGGLVEALFLARINSLADKAPVFTCLKAPRDKSGKTLPLNEWTLKNYIDVADELKWITVSAKDVSSIIRDYRNYVHPYKEHSHGVSVCRDDAILFWEVAKQLARQVLR